MNKKTILELLRQIIQDRGVPRNIRTALEDSLRILETGGPKEEKLSYIISALDEISSDPNLSVSARTKIWSVVSALEKERS